jgi:hypothetical protein
MGAFSGDVREADADVVSALNVLGLACCDIGSGALVPRECAEHPRESVERATTLIDSANLPRYASRPKTLGFSGYAILAISC